MKIRNRTRIAVPLATAAVALATASTAWACTDFAGQTRINGLTSTAAVKGAPLVITGDGVKSVAEGWPADTGDRGPYWDAVATTDTCCYGGTVISTEKASLDRESTPDLGPINANAPTWKGQPSQKTYQVCMLPDNGNLQATNPAYLTVT